MNPLILGIDSYVLHNLATLMGMHNTVVNSFISDIFLKMA